MSWLQRINRYSEAGNERADNQPGEKKQVPFSAPASLTERWLAGMWSVSKEMCHSFVIVGLVISENEEARRDTKSGRASSRWMTWGYEALVMYL